MLDFGKANANLIQASPKQCSGDRYFAGASVPGTKVQYPAALGFSVQALKDSTVLTELLRTLTVQSEPYGVDGHDKVEGMIMLVGWKLWSFILES